MQVHGERKHARMGLHAAVTARPSLPAVSASTGSSQHIKKRLL